MNQVKKILFVSCSAGSGHKRAAEALHLTCQQAYPHIESAHIDINEYSDWIIKKSIDSGYNFLVKYAPELYGLLYDAGDFSKTAELLNHFSSLLKINTRRLNKFVSDFNPDRIICTHFLASAFLKKFAKTIPLDLLLTDYELNKIILNPSVRYFFAPTKEVSADISQYGKKSFVTGIPIHPEFKKNKNLDKTVDDFGLTKNNPTILLMTGGGGLIDPSKILFDLTKKITQTNIIAIAGKNNRKLFDKLKNSIHPNNSNAKIIDFTERIDELIKLSDVIITKPGGLTVTECLFLKKPLLLISPIPGQEEANVNFVEKNNYGRHVTDHNLICDEVTNILSGKTCFSSPALTTDPCEKILQISLAYY
jgi:processive 1,2-diacylglycerol beta-glucosyltransferase